MKLEDLKSDWFLAINPNGKSPAMVDGDLKLFESAAICNYIARQTPDKNLIPNDSHGIARYEQWQFFIMSELEQPLWSMGKHSFVLPQEYRLDGMKNTALYEWSRALKVLETGLTGPYLLGEQLTVLDIMAAHTLRWAHRYDVPAYSTVVEDYHQRVQSKYLK